MATSSSNTSSPAMSFPKSPKSPRQLPQLPGQRSPNNQLSIRSPSTPRVFEFPPEFSSGGQAAAETPNTNFDFDDFARAVDAKSPQEFSAPKSPSLYGSSSSAGPKSPSIFGGSCGTPVTCTSKSPGTASPSRAKSPIFQFCNPRRNISKTLSYPPKSPLSPSVSIHSQASSSLKYVSGPKQIERRRNSSLSSPSIVTPPGRTSPKPQDSPELEMRESNSPGNPLGKIQGNAWNRESLKMHTRQGRTTGYLNKSQGCLNEAVKKEVRSGTSVKSERNMSRKSTSDLTELNDADTEVTILSSPRRRGSMKGGLAYLASRRGSRDSQASNLSNVSNEEIGPLNFSAHPRVRQRRTSNFLELPVPDHIRPRVHSLPEKAYNPRAGDDLYRLRAFSITHKGVVNRGDSIISRRSRSNTSVNSSRNSNVSGERSPFEGSCCSGQGVAADSTESEGEEVTKYRVVLLGDSGVGKTALVSQFMTSEYMNTYDASLDDEFGEKTVSILLDGEESEMIFIDHPHVEMSLENSLSTYEPHACVVVYSIVSRPSFQVAEEMLNYLWREHYTQERSVIVVGNKSDLARSRTISANEGKHLATSRECKFIETSSGIQHNVDELLVGVLKQIRLRESRDRKLRRQGSKGKMLSKLHGSKTALSLNLAREILNKMCLNDSKSKSCENLHVL
ncbi:uncharacterized protein LOC100119620 isoform X2 [Nasonia vitripennis]|uniref:Uncharacterized protein n=1 Tax=Nasonia vitripennis TaxID=7425 RepID=A0A7M7H935_NASVI|nr:uncharacterized protein LOC100119620 isoform X2 [Nasonia vitripennis]